MENKSFPTQYWHALNDGRIRCDVCPRECKLGIGKRGLCFVRANENNQIVLTTYGRSSGFCIDPIEKKPLYHFLPGSLTYSIGTVGCNLHCSYCQNWEISQVTKAARGSRLEAQGTKPEEIVKKAIELGCKSISYTYTEPTIFFEYAYDVARLAKKQGLYNNFVTNGYMTAQALETIRPYLDSANVDLKGFTEDYYSRFCHGHLEPVLESIRLMKKLGIWVEITTLIIPGQNDSEKELRGLAEFIAGVGKEIPWHISRFHPEYKHLDSGPTPVETLKKARAIGEKAGLRYIYLGNVLEGNDTYCYNCRSLLIRRMGFDVTENNIENNKCNKCNITIDGVF